MKHKKKPRQTPTNEERRAATQKKEAAIAARVKANKEKQRTLTTSRGTFTGEAARRERSIQGFSGGATLNEKERRIQGLIKSGKFKEELERLEGGVDLSPSEQFERFEALTPEEQNIVEIEGQVVGPRTQTEQEIFETAQEGFEGGASAITAGDIISLAGLGGLGKGLVVKGGKIVFNKASSNAIKSANKQQAVIEETIRVNRMRATTGFSEQQVKNIFKASEKEGANLLTKIGKIAKSKAGIISAVTLFTTTLGIQVMQFWASVDNVAGLASLDAYLLVDATAFTDISTQEIDAEIRRINAQMEFAREAARVAQWINPVTGWALGKFYRKVIELTQLSIDAKLGRIQEAEGL